MIILIIKNAEGFPFAVVFIDNSMLNSDNKEKFKELINKRYQRLKLGNI